MSTIQPQAPGGADLQVGDTVRYQSMLYNTTGRTTDGIIVRIIPLADTYRYYILNLNPDHIRLLVISAALLLERVNTDHRDMSPEYILALHGAANLGI
jgi:hypothetical protein